jgi:hypothetical protein
MPCRAHAMLCHVMSCNAWDCVFQDVDGVGGARHQGTLCVGIRASFSTAPSIPRPGVAVLVLLVLAVRTRKKIEGSRARPYSCAGSLFVGDGCVALSWPSCPVKLARPGPAACAVEVGAAGTGSSCRAHAHEHLLVLGGFASISETNDATMCRCTGGLICANQDSRLGGETGGRRRGARQPRNSAAASERWDQTPSLPPAR